VDELDQRFDQFIFIYFLFKASALYNTGSNIKQQHKCAQNKYDIYVVNSKLKNVLGSFLQSN
jgi:hypothetical protein